MEYLVTLKMIHRELNLKNKQQQFCQGKSRWTKANQLLGWHFSKESQSTDITEWQTLTDNLQERPSATSKDTQQFGVAFVGK